MLYYYVLDTETTGLKAGYHEVNQISCLRVSDGEIIIVDIKVDFPERVNQISLEIQGKTKSDLLKGIDKREGIKLVHDFISSDNHKLEERCMVAHNASFDQRFTHMEWDVVGLVFPANLWLCTKTLGRKYVKKVGEQKIIKAQRTPKVKYGLNILMEGVGLTPKTGAHDAQVDTENCSELFNFLMNSEIEHVSSIKRVPHKEDVKAKSVIPDDY